MALTDVYYSPAGAGTQSGADAANAKAAISGSSWSLTLQSENRQNTRWIFLGGTYNVNSELTSSSLVPNADNPHYWVGADSAGNLLEPTFDSTGMHLVTTNYPKIIQSANVTIYDSEPHSVVKCMYFENTNASYSKLSVYNETFAEVYRSFFLGVYMKAACASTGSSVHANYASRSVMCEIVSTGTAYAALVLNGGTVYGTLYMCRIYGPSKTGTGTGMGIKADTAGNTIVGCIVDNVHGDGVVHGGAANAAGVISNNTIVRCGGDGIDSSGFEDENSGVSIDNNIFYDIGGYALNANAGDGDALVGSQIATGAITLGNFNNLDNYEYVFSVVSVSTTDFVNYANQDYRIKRSSALYKNAKSGSENFGAAQNEDYEFSSVS